MLVTVKDEAEESTRAAAALIVDRIRGGHLRPLCVAAESSPRPVYRAFAYYRLGTARDLSLSRSHSMSWSPADQRSFAGRDHRNTRQRMATPHRWRLHFHPRALIVSFALQRYFVRGLLAGSTNG